MRLKYRKHSKWCLLLLKMALLENEYIRFASQPLAELDEAGFLWIEEGSRVM